MSINLDRVSDAQTVAEKLTGLPKEALLYIAGYAEGCRDKPTRKRRKAEKTNGEKEDGAGIKEEGGNMLGPEEKSGLVIRSIAGKTDIYLNGVCINDKCLSCEVKIEGPYRPKATISLLCERIEMDIGKNVEVKKVNRSESQGC